MMPLLAAAGYFTLSFDLAGQYQSAAAGPEVTPPRAHYDHELFVNDLLAVLGSSTAPARHRILLCRRHCRTGVRRAPGLRQPHPAQLPAAVRAEFPWREQDRSGDRARQRPRRCGADDVGNPAQSRAGPTRSAPFRPGTLRAHPARLGARHRRSDAAQSRHQRPAGASRPAQARRGRRTRSLADGAARRLRPFARADFVVYPTGHSPCETSPHQLCRDLVALYATAEP